MEELRDALRSTREAHELMSRAALMMYQARFDFSPEQAKRFGRLLMTEPHIHTLLDDARNTTEFKRNFHAYMAAPTPHGAKRNPNTTWWPHLMKYEETRYQRHTRQAAMAASRGFNQLKADEDTFLHTANHHLQAAKSDNAIDEAPQSEDHQAAARREWEVLHADPERFRADASDQRPPIVLKAKRPPVVLSAGAAKRGRG